jgi:hypothetical protein
MAKPKSTPESRAQLSMLLPIDTRRGSSRSQGDNCTPLSTRIADNREVVLRNLEKSGLRIPRS